MSRSFKKVAISKDNGGKNNKKLYHRQVRSSIKTRLRSMDIEDIDEDVLPVQQEIVNDYNYSDWKFVCEGDNEYCKCLKEDGNRNKCKRK